MAPRNPSLLTPTNTASCTCQRENRARGCPEFSPRIPTYKGYKIILGPPTHGAKTTSFLSDGFHSSVAVQTETTLVSSSILWAPRKMCGLFPPPVQSPSPPRPAAPTRCGSRRGAAGKMPKTGFLPTGRLRDFLVQPENHFKITETNDPVM